MNVQKIQKVLLVGDFLIFRSGLKLLLEGEKTIKVVGETADLSEAAKLAGKIEPDVLIVDSTEVSADNFSAFAGALPRPISIIVITSSDEVETHRKYLMLGADGLVTKTQPADVLFEAVKQVGAGNVWFDGKLMRDTVKLLVEEKKSLPQKIFAHNSAVLTEREREVLLSICEGLKNREIADKLFITETTVRHHLTSIFEKLKVSSRLELVVHAFREKLVELPEERGGEEREGLFESWV